MSDDFSCIIVDDEPKAIGLLESNLKVLYSNLHISNTYTSAAKAFVALSEQTIDLLFLDIAMPEQTGFSMLNALPDLKAEVIFVTAHPEYALNAFKFTPTGYLLKPIDETELRFTVDKAMERVIHKRTL